MPEIVIVEAGAVGDAELLAVEIELVAVDDGPKRALRQRKFAGENAGLQRGCVRLPIGADEICGEGALDAGEAEDGFGIAGIYRVPEAPEIFEHGVAAAVEEGVLKAVGFIAG